MGKDNFPFPTINEKHNNSNSLDIIEIENEVQSAFKLMSTLAHKMEARLGELKEKENNWNELQKKVTEERNKSDFKVCLNVGGQKFTTSSSTLLSQSGTFFEVMLSNKEEMDKNGEYFIDRDPKYFGLVLNFLRDGRLRTGSVKPEELEEIQFEFEYYKIVCSFPTNERVSPITTTTTTTTTTSSNYDNYSNNTLHKGDSSKQNSILSLPLMNTLKQWLPGRKFELIFKATRDGFQNSDFQQKCDNKGPTLTILQSSENFVFGAFSFLSFDSINYVYKTHPKSFLFTLTNPHSISPTRYYLKEGEERRVCGRWTDITKRMMIGWGEDLQLVGNPNVCSSLVCFPTSFIDSSGYADLTFTGSASFKLLDMEVYSL